MPSWSANSIRGAHEPGLGGYAKRVDSPAKMYPVGVLFGLGFDTATEVALLVLAGSAVVGGLPFYAVISLPSSSPPACVSSTPSTAAS